MKQRISGLDLRILSSELESSLVNYRLQNIYNASNSSRQYLLKFSVPDSKHMMIVECGNRVHLTDFDIPITQTPSNFVTKLRKHLKTRRLTGLKQIHNDRILVLQFSEGLYYLVFEFFSAGNIILLDENFKILSLNRLVQEKADNDKYAVNETYKMFDKSLFTEPFVYKKSEFTVEQVQSWIDLHKQKVQTNAENSKKNKVYSIHKLLFANSSHLPADLILKNLIRIGVNGSASSLEFDGDDEKLSQIVQGLQSAEDDFLALTAKDSEVTGCIVSKRNPHYRPDESEAGQDSRSLEFLLDEFHPFQPYKEHLENYKFTEVRGYNKTLDSFFSTIESTKNSVRIDKQKQQATNRLEHARSERDKQIQSLVQQQEANMKKGDTIIYCADLVSACCAMVQALVDQQMDWTNIESYITLEQNRGNATAKAIKLPLNLKDNKINIILPDIDTLDDEGLSSDLSSSESESDSEDSDSDSDADDSDSDSDIEDRPIKKQPKTKKNAKAKDIKKSLTAWIDLSLSPYANASLYFDTKKNAETKQMKVEKSTNIALKNAEKKITRDLTENLKQESETLKQIRPKFWFEKFYWFVSSDGYLCLAGRDDSQTDMIYFRHFNDNDFFVSAEMEGSLKVFVKNPFKGEDIPPSTLVQAGIFAISSSSAWNGKAMVSAWVVSGTQVSKKDFDDTLIGPGAFNFKGKKEYLPPAQLVMGLGFYLLGDSETTSKYKTIRETREKEHGLKIVMDSKKQDLDIEKLKFKENQEIPEIAEPVKREETSSPTVPGAESSNESSASNDDSSSIAEGKSVVKKVRGKKAKMKKIATKYADQDEEERLLRMDALGTLRQMRQLEQQKEEEKKKEAEKEQAKYKESAAIQRRKKQDSREYLKYLMQEVNEDESSVTNYLEILDSFICKPQLNDQFAAAVPVFAPWSSLNKFKYKVKITPGNGKKGKAVNDAINYFVHRKVDTSCTDTDLDWPREREFIEAIKPNDTMGVFTVNKLKLVLPGGSSADSKSLKKSVPKRGGKKGKK